MPTTANSVARGMFEYIEHLVLASPISNTTLQIAGLISPFDALARWHPEVRALIPPEGLESFDRLYNRVLERAEMSGNWPDHMFPPKDDPFSPYK